MSSRGHEGGLRLIKPKKMPDILPSSITEEEKPEFKWVDPTSLSVEEKYQRNMTERSTKMIRKIVKEFAWQRFKPPVCAYGVGGKLFVIDGQHTAMAAASHPKVKKIPVMIVQAVSVKDRASAFMGHNRDRVAVTAPQMFFSAVAAEDPIAITVKSALNDTGAEIVRYNPPAGRWQLGQTMAVAVLMKLAESKGQRGCARVLKILMDAKRAPIVAIEVAAVADLIWGKEWAGKFTDEDLSTVIRLKGCDEWKGKATAEIIKGQSIQMKRALAILWYKRVPKIRSKGSVIPIKTL